MPDPIDAKRARTFPGRISNADPADLPDGAMENQENWESVVPGRLTVRKGKRPITFDHSVTGSSNYVRSMHRDKHGMGDYILYERSDGAIYYGREPDAGTVATAPGALASGLSTAFKSRFYSSRFGDVYSANGMDRPRRWDKVNTTMDLAGIDAPAVAPAFAEEAGGASDTGVYLATYRYVEDDGHLGQILYSNVSPTTSLTTTGDNKEFLYGIATDFSPSSQTRITGIGGFIEIFRTTFGQSKTYYRVAKIGYGNTITAISSGAGVYTVTTQTPHGLVAGSRVKMASHSATLTLNAVTNFATNAYSLVTATPTATTFTILAADTTSATADGVLSAGTIGYRVTGFRTTAAGAGGDVMSDATLTSDALNVWFMALPVLNAQGIDADGSASSHTPPPDFMSVFERFQDRGVALAPVIYSTGTASATSGSATVSGNGTAWTAQMAGRYIRLKGATRDYLISSATATSITLAENYVGTNLSNVDYAIAPHYLEFNNIYFSEVDLLESWPVTNVVPKQENIKDHDWIVGGMPLGASFFVLKNRHIYELTWFRQPIIDAKTTLKEERGAFNQDCWARYGSVAYLMDQMGAYTFNGVKATPISGPLQDVFREVDIDFSKSSTFHVQVDPEWGIAYFFVHFVGDGQTYPTRALCYGIHTKAWWTMTSPQPIASGCWAEIGGRIRLLLGSLNEQIYLANQGVADGLATAVAKTAAAAGGAATVKVAQAGFTSNEWKNASVAVYHQTGAMEVRLISASGATDGDGNVTITAISNWTTAPAAGDVIVVGGIVATAKTKSYEVVAGAAGERGNERGLQISYLPTANAAYLTGVRYLDYDTTAQTQLSGTKTVVGMRPIPNTSYMEFLLASAATTQGASRGHYRWGHPGRTNERQNASHAITYELKAVQGLDAIAIDELIVEGVAA